MCGRHSAFVADWLRPPFLHVVRGEKKIEFLAEFASATAAAVCGAKVPPARAFAAVPFTAARGRFLEEDLHFDGSTHLPMFEAAAFLEPRLLRRASPHGDPSVRTELG